MFKKIIIRILPYILILIFSISLYYPVFENGYITKGDQPVHLYKAHFLADHIIPEQKWINGWCPWEYAGYDIFLTYPPLFYFLIAAFHYISGISVDFCYKLIFIFLYFLIGSASYYHLERKFKFFLSLLISFIFMLSSLLYSMQIIGFLPFIFSIGLFLFFISFMEDIYKDMNRANILKGSLLLAGIIPAHIFTATVAIAFLFICMIVKCLTSQKYREVLKNYLSILFLACLVNLYYLYNIIYIHLITLSIPVIGEPVSYNKFPLSSIIWDILNFRFVWKSQGGLLENLGINETPMLFLIVFILGLYGIISYLGNYNKNSKDSFPLALFIFSIVTVFLHSLSFLPKKFQILFFTQEYISVRLMVFFLFVILYFASMTLNSLKNNTGKKTFPIILSLLVILIFSRKVYYSPENLGMFYRIPMSKSLENLWSWINLNVKKEEGRIVYQDTYHNSTPENNPYFFSHIMSLSAMKTNIPQLIFIIVAENQNFFRNMSMENYLIFGKPVMEITDIEICNKMKIFNASYIVSFEDILRNKLANSSLFVTAASFPPFTVFKTREESKWFEFDYAGTSCNILSWKDNLMVLNIENPVENNLMLLKISWHPYWKAYINGKETYISRNKFNLIEVPLPEKGNIKLELRYSSFNPLTVIVSTVSLLSLIISLCIFSYKEVKYGKK